MTVVTVLCILAALLGGVHVGASVAKGERRALHRQLAAARHAATHDPLTALPNRAGLDVELDARRRHRSGCTLVMIDVDHFKQINDTYGHAVGDTVLCAIGDRLAAAVGDDGFAARLAGDEFVAILPSQPGLPDKIKCLHTDLTEQPVYIDDKHNFTVGLSLGAYRAPRLASAAEIKARADMAMYRAKRTGEHCAIYHPVFDGPLDHVEFRPTQRRRDRIVAGNGPRATGG